LTLKDIANLDAESFNFIITDIRRRLCDHSRLQYPGEHLQHGSEILS
jgi:hypothetical protein